MKTRFWIGIALLWLCTACYNDKEEILYPRSVQTVDCDTTAINYIKVQNIVSRSCYTCHSPEKLSSGIDLSTYATLKPYAVNGTLVGCIQQSDPRYRPMPSDGSKLPDCEINVIAAWCNAGAPN